MDISNPRVLYVKAGLFLLAGGMAAGVLLLEHPSVKVAALVAVSVWCFARAYYFAFYVVQHYADPGYRFAGLWSFAAYVLRRRRAAAAAGAAGGDRRAPV
jgi:hypothetical protein